MIADGKILSKSQLGEPYLLRGEEFKSKLCQLSLVVPAYNEEERLPHMLKTHIDYIREQQIAGNLPGLVEFVIIDDGSRDKTWEII